MIVKRTRKGNHSVTGGTPKFYLGVVLALCARNETLNDTGSSHEFREKGSVSSDFFKPKLVGPGLDRFGGYKTVLPFAVFFSR